MRRPLFTALLTLALALPAALSSGALLLSRFALNREEHAEVRAALDARR